MFLRASRACARRWAGWTALVCTTLPGRGWAGDAAPEPAPAAAGAGSAPATASPATPASPSASKLTREQIQQLHERCQQQIDEDRAVEAAQCLERVYGGLVGLDSSATVDLYYVLSDAVAVLQATAAGDPRDLCRADALLQDYRKRDRRLTARRYDGKVGGLHKTVAAALEQARGQAQRDICAEEAPTSVEAPTPAEADAPADAPAEPTDAPVVQPGEPMPRVTGKLSAKGPVTPLKRTSPRRRLFASRLPYTAMLDASFGVTLAGIAGAGVGAALYIYGLECKDGPPRCSDAAPTGVRDAGLVLMSAGAATMIIGFGLRFADHRAARKALRAMPQPAAGPTALGLTWRGHF